MFNQVEHSKRHRGDMTETTMTLDQLGEGQSAKIKKVLGDGALRRRLMDMGFTVGAEIEMVRPSPFGDPVEYRLRGYALTLRKSECQSIEIELI